LAAQNVLRASATAAFAAAMCDGVSAVDENSVNTSEQENCLLCAVEAALVAKTYSSAAPNSAHHNITLLHNKHGHQDMKKICEYYNIPVPKHLPPCIPCIRG
jgi:hypothetical protein